MSAAAKLAICEKANQARAEYASENAWMKDQMRKCDMTKQRMELSLNHTEDYKEILRDAGFTQFRNGIANRSSKVKDGERKGGLAMRRQGGGRKDMCGEMKSGVKTWLENERSHGHFVDQKDLYEEYVDQVNASVNQQLQQVRRLVQDASKPGSSQKIVEFQILKRKARVLELEERLQKLTDSRKYRESFTRRLMRNVGGSLFKPQRVTTLTMEEERIRCLATWHHFDHMLSLGAFGGEEELKAHVSNQKAWIENVENTTILFSDQVPFWCKIGAGNQVYCEAEVQSKKAKKVYGGPGKQKSGFDDEELEDVFGQTDPGESSLRRGLAHSEQTKFRVTYEATQAVLNYFSKDKTSQPIGVVMKGLLIVSGVHARLSNISLDGKWIEDEEFLYKNKHVVRKAGKPAGRILASFRKVREQKPEMFEDINVMSQPSAFCDSIILHWNQIELSKNTVQNVHQRDLFAGALSVSAKASCAASQSISAWIQGNMTAVLQLTDTDFSFSFKSSARSIMADLRREMKRKAAAEGVQATFKCGSYEIMRIVSYAHAEQVKRNTETDWVLKGLEEHDAQHET